MDPIDLCFLDPSAERLIAPGSGERLASGFLFTEGPLWDPHSHSLLFSDIPANRIYRWSAAGGVAVYREPSAKANGLAWDLDGSLLACEHLGRRVSRERDGALETVAGSFGGRLLNSPNDLVVAPDGAIYFTDPPYGIESPSVGEPREREQPVNGVYRIPPGGGEPALLVADFDRPNGLAFSPDRAVLYIADTPRYHIRRFEVQPDGTLSGGQVLAVLPAEAGEGRPDGMKIDEEGHVYCTGPGGIWVLSPHGELIAHLRLPERAANCGWGDADRRGLYVTACTSLYRIRTHVPGV